MATRRLVNIYQYLREYRPNRREDVPEKDNRGNITSIRPTSEAKPKDMC